VIVVSARDELSHVKETKMIEEEPTAALSRAVSPCIRQEILHSCVPRNHLKASTPASLCS
jgi:hypothetical protein